MLTPKEAYFRFKGKYPKLEPSEAGLYKRKFYIFVASEMKDEVDYNDPYYVIDALTGRFVNFNPFDDIKGLQDAMVNHPVDWR